MLNKNKIHYNYNRVNRRTYLNNRTRVASQPMANHRQGNLKYLIIAAVLVLALIGINFTNHKKPAKSTRTIVAATQSTSKPATPTKPVTLKLPDIKNNKLTAIPKRKSGVTDPSIPAKTAILYDVEDNYPLYEKNADKEVPIASITKIMTALVALDQYKLDQVATVPASAATIYGSKMNLYTGEQITVENLLYGLMLPSGNDAAYTLALLDPKSKNTDTKPFVDKMNQKAKLLGLKDTFFYCPAGLDDRGHSTARDLAFLTAYALKNPTFAQVVSTAQKSVSSVDNRYHHNLANANRLVVPNEPYYMSSAIGVKTGFTGEAGHSLVGAARQNGHTLISVVLNTNNPAPTESARLNYTLLTWGFDSIQWPN